MMMTSQQQDQQRDIDELSDTTSELATAIHASSFASAAHPQQQRRLAPDSSVVAQAGGGGGGGGRSAAAADGGGSQNAQPVQESSFFKPTTTTFAGGAPTSHPLSADDAKQRGKTIVFVAVAAIVVAIAVVAYVTSRSDGTGGDGSDPRSIVDQVIQDVSSNVALRDPDSPQHRAREWMTKVDQLTAVIIQEGLDRIHQRYALATFYFATGGGDRRWNRAVVVGEPPFDFLNPATSECKWSGIVCASTDPLDETTVGGGSNRRLRRLHDRQRRVLQGEESDVAAATASAAPDTAANTNINSTVIGLSFSHRNLTGTLPPELGTMSFLRRMDLSSNQLVGTIPDEAVMAKMKNMWWLDLSDNRFIGNIPKSLWRLPELTHLFLFRNQLSGKIERHEDASSVTAASSSPTTTTTNAGAADTGEVTSSLIKPLREVYLYENQLTGRLPSWFHELDQLDRWLSYKNQLTGPLPVLQPEKLSVLDVSFNQLAGTIPPSLWATGSPLPPLEALYLEHNQLTGSIPNSTEPQQVIKLVSVHNNRLSGRIPEGFGLAWPNIQELRLHNNTITGTIPSSLWGEAQSPEKLTHINLSGNDLSGVLPGSAQVRDLQEVRLQDNPRLGGTIPTDFAYTWTNLSVLEIQDTALVGQLGPNVTSPSGECPTVWPRYSEVVTSFRFAANCYQLFVTDPNPPVQCDCCTDCVKV